MSTADLDTAATSASSLAALPAGGATQMILGPCLVEGMGEANMVERMNTWGAIRDQELLDLRSNLVATQVAVSTTFDQAKETLLGIVVNFRAEAETLRQHGQYEGTQSVARPAQVVAEARTRFDAQEVRFTESLARASVTTCSRRATDCCASYCPCWRNASASARKFTTMPSKVALASSKVVETATWVPTRSDRRSSSAWSRTAPQVFIRSTMVASVMPTKRRGPKISCVALPAGIDARLLLAEAAAAASASAVLMAAVKQAGDKTQGVETVDRRLRYHAHTKVCAQCFFTDIVLSQSVDGRTLCVTIHVHERCTCYAMRGMWGPIVQARMCHVLCFHLSQCGDGRSTV